ncbi:Muniscin C-terminal mu-like proteiny domain-containing protein [Debaryomyces fabryi]|uniref:Muniscin C-terminal mu-like proteiny domain-containing protein n=1 Tax=Debaryomyces fabryi TaxID=58627 RepID=A0A0V1PUU8_9ASCO|nr:Muniscin C-terminal mu-like proteiny domain-containing protein [Debaryomyces fabryi]KSA00057.1 Muniscin C-terminal mu-like proteiny domain-containing protein [Debaryomyces fabryi]CUM56568.1 unnamed protein product [Debaryomyces fabryi]
MAESQYSYGTSILTSKTPQEAAAIIPSSINATQGLLEKNLLGFFNEYTQLLQRNNQALNQLLQNGSKIFGQQQNKEYEGFHKVWNCLLSSIQVEIHSNETLFKNLKLEAIGPLKDVFQKDVRYSELLVNSQELQEISSDLSHNSSNAEMQWNMKAPQIFDNFENFKKFETQLLFDVSYSLLNGLNTKYSKNLSNNENSVNYVLNGYKIDTEMANYLEYVLQKKDFVTTAPGSSAAGTASVSKTNSRQSRQVSHSDLNSMNSSATLGSASTNLKKPSKLKSKMGSIFGRKNKLKRTSGLGGGTIPETESVTSSVNTNPRLNKSTDSIDHLAQNNVNRTTSVRDSRRPSELELQAVQPSSSEQYQEGPLQQQPVQQQRGDPRSQHQLIPQQQVPHEQIQKQQVQQPQLASLNAAPLTPKPISDNNQVVDSPNVVKYDSETSDDEFEDPNNKGNRLSMLQRHSLGGPENGSPIVGSFPNESDTQSQQQEQSGLLGVGQHGNERHTGRLSQSSAGKYSFEAGDEENSMTPKQQENIFEDKVGELNVNDNAGSNVDNHFLRNAAVASGAGIAGAGAAVGNMYGHHQQQKQPQQEQTLPQQFQQQHEQHEQQQNSYEYPQEKSQYQDSQQYQQPSLQNQGHLENQEFQQFIPQQQNQQELKQESQQYSELLQQKGSGLPPPPPKARKVLHRESSLRNQNTSSPKDAPSLVSVPSNSTDSRTNRRDIHSQMFHNLPNARASVIQQPTLVSQDTGNSLLRNSDYFKHFDSSNYVESNGLNSSIAEVINVNIKNDQLVKSQIIGEIAFNYKKQIDEQIEPILIRIPNQFDKIILNNTYIEKLSNEEFNINPELIVSKTLGGMKYLKNITFEEVPILILQIWKFESHQSSLMISLKLNPNYSSSLVINNLVISVALDSSCETLNASSRPQGSFNKDKNRITWRYTQPLNLSTSNLEEKLIARFATNGIGSEHESGIQVKFSIHDPPHQPNILNYRNEPIPCVKNLITGSYSGHS